MAATTTITIRLYEHRETRARVEGDESEVEAHGWDFAVGDSIQIDGVEHVLTSVGGSIQTGDMRGNFVRAEAVSAEDARS